MKQKSGFPRVFARRGLYERFQRAMTQAGVQRGKECLLLGISGGRDSVVLLHLLVVGGYSVVAAHLNHCLRGKESLRDQRFVRSLCQNWGIPLIEEKIWVRKLSRKHQRSLEEGARIARYHFLEKAALRRRIQKVLVAHHQRDQAETVLLKIFRGSVSESLRGMSLVRPFPRLSWGRKRRNLRRQSLWLIRPLLEAPVEELDLYVCQNKLVYCTDSSNRDLKHPRNWIRHRLLPLVEKRLNRNIIKTLARWGNS